MDISVRSEAWTTEDRSWLGSRDGTEFTETITLNTSTFTAGTHYPNGYVPSGVCLGKITATGLYGPYDDAATDGRQTAAGFLFNSTQMRSGGPNVGAPLLWRGVIKTANLPTGNGLDTNGRTDLAAKFRFK